MHTEGKEYFVAKANKDNFGKKERSFWQDC